MAAPPTKPDYIVVDVEATGPHLSVNRLIEIGAVRADNPEDTFHCFVQIDEDTVVDEWVQQTIPHVVEAARKQGLPVEEAAQRMAAWLKSDDPEKTPVMVGYVIGLDWRAMCELFEHGLGPNENPFHYKPIDICPLAMGALGLPWGFDRETMDQKLGVPLLAEDKAHNALFDAQQHTLEFNALRAHMEPIWAAYEAENKSSESTPSD